MGNQLSSSLPEDWATVDMVAQHVYCPRRFHLMYVEGRREDNSYTLEGKAIHRRVDRIDQLLPELADPEQPATDLTGDEPPEIARSVSMADDELGLMGKFDLVSCDPEGGEAIPLETKRGRVPANSFHAEELLTDTRLGETIRPPERPQHVWTCPSVEGNCHRRIKRRQPVASPPF